MKNLIRVSKFTVFIAVFLVGSHCFGQGGYFLYKTVRSEKDFSFPVFYNKQDSLTTEKINQLLQIAELEQLKGYEKGNIFEYVRHDNGTIYGGKVNISFIIYNNSIKYLSIQFDEASSGATMAYWNRYYNFNSGNGDMFQLRDLITDTSFKRFRKYVADKRVKQLKKAIPKKELENLKYIIDRYKEDSLTDFYIKNNTLYIDGNNCFNKNDKFFGIETITKFKLDEFKHYLNDYGKTVFSITDDPVSKYRSHYLPQLYTGTIGKTMKILLVLNSENDEMRGEYVYLKSGHGIYLEGKMEKGYLNLSEKDPDFKETGTIEAEFDGQKIEGTYTSTVKKKSYKISAVRK